MPESLFRPGSSSSETLQSTPGSPSSAFSSSTIRPCTKTPKIVDLTMETDEDEEAEKLMDIVPGEVTGPIK